eukprot:15367174-Ditylum_brightwellii.AAC.2
MGKFAKTTHKAEWKELMFENYEEMDNSGTLTAPLLRSDLPPDAKILFSQPAFKVKLQEEANMYKLYTHMAATGASQIEGIGFEASYPPTSTNIEEQIKDRIWLSIPPFYLEWFFARYPYYPLNGIPADQLCLQNIQAFQGTKDASRKWYRLLDCIFEN